MIISLAHNTHTHTQPKQSLWLTTGGHWSCLPGEPVMGHLCTFLMLEPLLEDPPGAKMQEAAPCLTSE